MLNNRARDGGAILVTESTIIMYGETTITNNTATNGNGGGICLHQSVLEIKENSTVSHNHAVRGGGIHVSSSSISVQQQSTLQLVNNTAETNGGGMYLEINPRLYLLNTEYASNKMIFTGNHANYGGAVYVADNTNSAACSSTVECFIQTLALHQAPTYCYGSCTADIILSGNTAAEHGSNLFGGLLDRCIPSPFAEVYQKYDRPEEDKSHRRHRQYNGVTYIGNISDITLDSIASQPVRVCFCNNEGRPDCSYLSLIHI